MSDDRHSVAETPSLLKDPYEIALREAENGIKQFDLAIETIRSFVKDKDRPFRLRSPLILRLHQAALDGIHPLAGTWRNSKVSIGKSKHVPPDAAFVSEEIQFLCDYVNNNWAMSAGHLGAYVLWKLNWIHPFADGNGRTARATSYVVMSAKLDSLLPGAPTIPEQIAANKGPYYKALEVADQHLMHGSVDVSDLETMLNAMLATQLLNAAKQASGEIASPIAGEIFTEHHFCCATIRQISSSPMKRSSARLLYRTRKTRTAPRSIRATLAVPMSAGHHEFMCTKSRSSG